MSIFAQETYVDATRNAGCGESDVHETFADRPGELFRFMRREYGRCTGRVYVDLPGRPAVPVGWIFQARVRYEDCDETYLREVWVTLHERPDTVTRTAHWHALDAPLEVPA